MLIECVYCHFKYSHHRTHTCTSCEKQMCEKHAIKCSMCYSSNCHEHLEKCEVCENQLCANCVHKCQDCNTTLCKDHTGECHACGDEYCSTHIEECGEIGCETNMCEKHTHICLNCRKRVCINHIIVCEECYEELCLWCYQVHKRTTKTDQKELNDNITYPIITFPSHKKISTFKKYGIQPTQISTWEHRKYNGYEMIIERRIAKDVVYIIKENQVKRNEKRANNLLHVTVNCFLKIMSKEVL